MILNMKFRNNRQGLDGNFSLLRVKISNNNNNNIAKSLVSDGLGSESSKSFNNM